MKLGKLPAVAGAIKLKLKNYINMSTLPVPNWNNFGYEWKVPDWQGSLGNNQHGCCVESGAAHETIALNAQAGVNVTFSDASVLSDYAAATGWNPNDPTTDRGSSMAGYASYRRRIGVVDANGTRHKVAAYLEISPKDLEEHLIAANLFGVVGLGFMCPDYIFHQFNGDEAWHYVPGPQNFIGGHYVPLVSRRKGMLRTNSWGRFQFMKDGFFEEFNDESVVYLSREFLLGGVSLNGFDYDHLLADLNALGITRASISAAHGGHPGRE